MTHTNKKILLIGCGGTISCVYNDMGNAVPTLSAQDLIEAVPALTNFAELSAHQFKQMPSCNMELNYVLELAELIENSHYDGFIITQGTDTMEETAFALDLIYQGAKPVIITGAMRHASLISPDGSGNLLAATIVACSASAENQGVMVVMNDTVHAARHVRKAHTSRLDAFDSGEAGILGYLSEDRYIQLNRLLELTKLNPRQIQQDTLKCNIPILTTHSGDDGQVLKLIIESGLHQGVVIDALGAGHVSSKLADQIGHAQGKLAVVVSSRTGAGSTYYSTYGAYGSEIQLIKQQAIMAGQLNAMQARIYLQLLLAMQLDHASIREAFDNFYQR